jgi:outer membrane protein assembly factor BamB
MTGLEQREHLMRSVTRSGWAFALALVPLVSTAGAQDWPQWRGPNRDAKATSFNAPETWPAELTQKWKVTVGDGVSTPAVVQDRVFVFTRQDDNEVIRCLDAASGEQIWQDQYPAEAPRGGASQYPGPRSSPSVADGKVVTLGVQGTLCCYDAATGKQLWRKDEFGNDVPMFNTSSSPIIVDGVCIAQLGGREEGGIVAFDLNSGDEKWRWTEDTPAYGSPVSLSVDGTEVIVTPTDKNLVAVANGETVWEMPFEPADRYNTFTPIVTGDILITAGPGPGFSAFKMTKDGNKLTEQRIWTNPDNSIKFNTPVLKNGLIFGLSNGNQLFCIDAKSGETAWTAPIARAGEGAAVERGVENVRNPRVRAIYVQATQEERRDRAGRGERGGFDRERRRGEGRGGFGRGGFGGRGRGGRRGGGGGYGSVVDAGSVLLALSPAGELVVFKPSEAAFDEVARYKVAQEGTYAYPVAVGEAIYIKDSDSLTRWGVN